MTWVEVSRGIIILDALHSGLTLLPGGMVQASASICQAGAPVDGSSDVIGFSNCHTNVDVSQQQ